jgi:hypothetical protein
MLANFLCAIIGFVIIATAIFDLLWTAFVEGAGPLSLRTMILVGRFQKNLRMRFTSRKIIPWAGLSVILASLTMWTGLLWVGWAFIFSSVPGAVVVAATHQPADLWQRIYFVGSTLFTLGIGDLLPHGHVFEILTDLCSASGFFVFGAALAYLVPVVSAATQKRSVAVYIWSLGHNPSDIIYRAWNGCDSSDLTNHFDALIPQLLTLGEMHLTYPVLHFFHSPKRAASAGANIAMLDEALSIIEFGINHSCGVQIARIHSVREAINQYVVTLAPVLQYVASTGAPPVPSIDVLRQGGLPTKPQDAYEKAISNQMERRQLLQRMARMEGWTWEHIHPSGLSIADEPRRRIVPADSPVETLAAN